MTMRLNRGHAVKPDNRQNKKQPNGEQILKRSKLNRPPRAKQNQKWCVGQQHHKRHLHLYRLKLHLESQEDAQEADHEEDIVVSTSEQYDESSMEITDMSGLDTMEIRRAELRAETEKLTQEIIALGQENPNVIDPLLLRRQKELAEKSQELQDLETAA